MVSVDAATKLNVVRGSQYRPPRMAALSTGDDHVLGTRHPSVPQALGGPGHLDDVVDPALVLPCGGIEPGIQVHHRRHDAETHRFPPPPPDAGAASDPMPWTLIRRAGRWRR